MPVIRRAAARPLVVLLIVRHAVEPTELDGETNAMLRTDHARRPGGVPRIMTAQRGVTKRDLRR